jgi:hypothetical protein
MSQEGGCCPVEAKVTALHLTQNRKATSATTSPPKWALYKKSALIPHSPQLQDFHTARPQL